MSFCFLNPIVDFQSFNFFTVTEAFDTVDLFPSSLKYFIPLSSRTHHFLLSISAWIAQRHLIDNVSKPKLLISLLKFSAYIGFFISVNSKSTPSVPQIKTLEQALTHHFFPDFRICPSNLVLLAPPSKYI